MYKFIAQKWHVIETGFLSNFVRHNCTFTYQFFSFFFFQQDAFSDYFPEQGATEDKLWKGLMFTAVGLVTLGTMVARS